MAYCTFISPTTPSALAIASVSDFSSVDHRRRQRVGRQGAGGIAGMDAGFLDMLHHAGDIDGLAVGDAVHIDLDRVVQVAVDQHRVVAGHAHRFAHVAMQAGAVVDDFHRAAAEHVAGTDDHRDSRCARRSSSASSAGTGDAVFGLQQAEPVQQLLEAFAVFRKVDGVGAGAEDRDAGLSPAPATVSAASARHTARCSPAACRSAARGGPGRSRPPRSAARNTAGRRCRNRC